MDIKAYKTFLNSNKALKDGYDISCIRNVICQCDELRNQKVKLYHGTSNQKASSILKDGFKIDRFSGTQPMGIGVYLTPDENLAKYFGNNILNVNTALKSTASFTMDALSGFRELGKEFFPKICKVVSKSPEKYIGDKTAITKKVAKLKDSDKDLLEFLVKNRKKDIDELAMKNLIKEESATIQSNLFTDVLKETDYTSIYSFNDIFGGILGRPMNQWIVTDLNEIKKITKKRQ